MLQLQILPQSLTVCKVAELGGFDMAGLYFIGNTDEELSLVCETRRTPAQTIAREDGWRALRVMGPLEFGLTGILAGIAAALAAANIPIFAVSTYDTDYVLIKAENLACAVETLWDAGYGVAENGEQDM